MTDTIEKPVETEQRRDAPVPNVRVDSHSDGDRIKGAVHVSHKHDSAHKHVTGRADYTDDIPEPAGTLHAYLGLSKVAHGIIRRMNLDPVRKAPGVIGVLTADDIPGMNDISPTGLHDEPIFAVDKVEFWGQPIFAVVAKTRDAARRAAALADVEYDALPHALDPVAAEEAGLPLVTKPLTLKRGDAGKRAGSCTAPHFRAHGGRWAGPYVSGRPHCDGHTR